MADAHARLLVPGATVVPAACHTLVGALSLRSLFPDGAAFSCDALPYLQRIFDLNGVPFDARLAMANPDPDCVVSSAGVVEELRFDRPEALDGSSTARLEILRDTPVDGLLCWIRLDAGAGAPVLDSLTDKTTWIPAYLPVFDTPVLARAGDTMTVAFERRASDDGVHPDYAVRAELTTKEGAFHGSFLSAHSPCPAQPPTDHVGHGLRVVPTPSYGRCVRRQRAGECWASRPPREGTSMRSSW
ncbi:hypothetical protein [Streptomyces decoyicus]|uniref:hypothetical protein n=1 Tax=Streptomyces decoyicus TaxID=249567 RepID=UPI0033A9B9F9